MPRTRREFLSASAAAAAGFAGLRLACDPRSAIAAAASSTAKFGELIVDPDSLLDLPKGFSYRVISRAGEEMDDGLLLPGLPDGMATFPGPDGLTLLVRNHELHACDQGAFGPTGERLPRAEADKLYDRGDAGVPLGGGVTTLVYDTRRQAVVRQFLSLGGTSRNCAGGPTPWGSWLTCEESCDTPTFSQDASQKCSASHGYAFEVPATAEPKLAEAKPLRAMGRFRREAVAVDPATGAVYQTEDMDDGAFYRFLPSEPGNLSAGGKLQALAIDDRPSLDTRNWVDTAVQTGEPMPVRWIDLVDPDAPKDDLRYRAFAAGGARFARGEGIWWTEGGAYFACTTGGKAEIGQLFRYEPTSADAGTLELFIEPNDTNLIHNADNLTAAPWGDLVVCEDRQGDVVRLVGVTPAGECYTLANNHVKSEFAGVAFSPDGTTLFVNLQVPGLTLAITGPWQTGA